VTSSPAAKRIVALPLIRAVIPASESLLTKFHLVPISFFAFLLDLCIVGIAFKTTGSALPEAHEEEGEDEDSGSSTTPAVNGKLRLLWKGGKFLCNGE
jgi:hypothetical protein